MKLLGGRVAAVAALMISMTACTGGDDDTSPVDILSPSSDARVTGAKLVARVKTDGPDFRATLNGHDVTSRFGKPDDGVREATFERRDLTDGKNALTAQVGTTYKDSHAVDVATFRVLKRDDQRLTTTDDSSKGAAPVAVTARSDKSVSSVRVAVNGKQVTEKHRQHSDGKGADIHLSARHGIKHGSNTVTTEVEHDDGTVARSTTKVDVPKTKPLADAGPDRVTAVGQCAALNGSKSKAPGGGKLTYQWKVVSAPDGSKATSVDPEAKTCFAPDKPGVYRLELTSSSGGAAGNDQTEVTVKPTADPMGMPIQTIRKNAGQSDDYAIVVGKDTYKRAGKWIQVVVLDPVSLEPVHGGAQAIGAGADLTKAITAAGKDDLVVISGQGNARSGAMPAADSDALKKAFDSIGATYGTRGSTGAGIDNFGNGDWSVIGRKKTPTGAAWQNYESQQAGVPGFLGGDAGRPGSLNGYLQIVTSRAYDFVSPEYVEIDTKASGSSDTVNVITVGDRKFTSASTGGGKAQGVHVLVLDSSDLSPANGAGGATYPVRKADGTLDDTQLVKLANDLTALSEEPKDKGAAARRHPPMVVMQTFGPTVKSVQAIGNHDSWVHDQMPGWGPHGGDDEGTDDFYRWCGGGETSPTLNTSDQGKVKCAPFPHNTLTSSPDASTSPGRGNHSTVTAAIGQMAGLPARNATANFGRPGQTAALAMVASAHPYNDNQQTVKLGEDGERLVATLRRTKQSQWRASTPSTTDSFDTAEFWKTALSPKTAWPLQDGPTTALGKASTYIVGEIFPDDAECDRSGDPCVTDIRTAYVPHISDDWDANYDQLRDEVDPPDGPDDVVTAFNQLKPKVLSEFRQLAQVQNMFKRYTGIFTDSESNTLLNMSDISGKIQTEALKDQEEFENKVVQVDKEAPVADALYFGADLIDFFPEGEFLGGALAFFASSWDLFSDIGDSESGESPVPHPPNVPQLVEDKASQVGHDLFLSYEELNLTLNHVMTLFAGDADKLKTASAHAKSKWNLPANSAKENLLIQSVSTGIKTSLYQALMPVAYEQWFISPVFTRDGTLNRSGQDVTKAGPIDYVCNTSPNPFKGSSSAPASSVNWLRYESSGQASENTKGGNDSANRRNHSIGSGLKSKANPMQPIRAESDHEYGAGEAQFPGIRPDAKTTTGGGSSPPADLVDPLFAKPSRADTPYDPSGLSMNKDEFFGLDAWSTPRLQCGPSFDQKYNGDPW